MLTNDRLMLRRPKRARRRARVRRSRYVFAPGDAQSGPVKLRFEKTGDAPPLPFTIEADRVTNIRFRRR